MDIIQSNRTPVLGNIVELPEKTNLSNLLEFVKNNSFCTLLGCEDNKLFISHINLISDGNVFIGHLSAANPQAKQLKDGSTILAIFDKSSSHNNHNAVHIHGKINIIKDEEQLTAMLDKLISKYESDKPSPWSIQWGDTEFKSQIKGIVGFTVTPSLIEEATVLIDAEKDRSLCASENSFYNKNISTPINIGDISLFRIISTFIPSYFVEQRPDVLDMLINNQPSCVAITYNKDGLLYAYHLDLIISAKKNGTLTLHGQLAISNAQSQLKAGDSLPAVVIFKGPHTYISPSWYKTAYSVPTWNYAIAHAHGAFKIIDQKNSGKDQMINIEFDVLKIEGQYKLNQNRTIEDKLCVIEGLSKSTCPADKKVGELMETFLSK